jgi:small redox-active disulfide protein 2
LKHISEVTVLDIKVLGPGCPNCKQLEEITRSELQKLGLEASIEKVTDYGQIMALGVISTPGLVINDQVMVYGRVPTRQEVIDWLVAAED